MSSIRQIEANRRNAFKSTGPTTPEGKQCSRCNAIRHGLTAETVIGVLEDSEDYQAFEAAVISDYDAQTAVERELVLRLASILWRLRRATGIESALFSSVAEESSTHDVRSPREVIREESKVAKHHQFSRGITSATQMEPCLNARNDLANRFLRLAALPTLPLDRLSRYEYMLWRQARQIVFALNASRRHTRQRNRHAFPFLFRASER